MDSPPSSSISVDASCELYLRNLHFCHFKIYVALRCICCYCFVYVCVAQKCVNIVCFIFSQRFSTVAHFFFNFIATCSRIERNWCTSAKVSVPIVFRLDSRVNSHEIFRFHSNNIIFFFLVCSLRYCFLSLSLSFSILLSHLFNYNSKNDGFFLLFACFFYPIKMNNNNFYNFTKLIQSV